MSKNFKAFLSFTLIVLVLGILFTLTVYYTKVKHQNQVELSLIASPRLDHDIYISSDSTQVLYNKVITGWDSPKCLHTPQVYTINNHHVMFNNVSFDYEKYQVVHDIIHPW